MQQSTSLSIHALRKICNAVTNHSFTHYEFATINRIALYLHCLPILQKPTKKACSNFREYFHDAFQVISVTYLNDKLYTASTGSTTVLFMKSVPSLFIYSIVPYFNNCQCFLKFPSVWHATCTGNYWRLSIYVTFKVLW